MSDEEKNIGEEIQEEGQQVKQGIDDLENLYDLISSIDTDHQTQNDNISIETDTGHSSSSADLDVTDANNSEQDKIIKDTDEEKGTNQFDQFQQKTGIDTKEDVSDNIGSALGDNSSVDAELSTNEVAETALSDGAESLAEKGAEDVAEESAKKLAEKIVGESVGEAVGSAFGGPIGAAVGKVAGSLIGKFIKYVVILVVGILVISTLFVQQLPSIIGNSMTSIRKEYQDDQLQKQTDDKKGMVDNYRVFQKTVLNEKKTYKDQANADYGNSSSSVGTIDNSMDSMTRLVNRDNPYDSTYVPSDLKEVEWQGTRTTELRAEPADEIVKMCKEAKLKGLEIYMLSGYRSYNTQKEIYDNYDPALRDKEVALPGSSEHQGGFAMDVTCEAVGFDLLESFGDTTEGKWIAENSYRYGFIVRYPKVENSDYVYEPWHLRYIGRKLAKKVYESGLTYDEYVAKNPTEDKPNQDTEDSNSWDTAYIVSAYSASMENYAKETEDNKTYLVDFIKKIPSLIKAAFTFHEIEYEVNLGTYVMVPEYEQKEVVVVDANNEKLKRTVYSMKGETTKLDKVTLPKYEEREFQVWQESTNTTKTERYYVPVENGEMVDYIPTKHTETRKKKSFNPMDKEVILVGLGMEPNEKHSKSTDMTNKQYVQRLYDVMQNTLDLPSDNSYGASGLNVGDWLWPVPTEYYPDEWDDMFGDRIHPISGEWSYHSGIDAGCPAGTPIVAPKDGIVIMARWNGGYGNCVQIDHQNSYVTLFGHLSGYAVNEGDTVKKGQVIGYIGSTGNSTGPHLHYTVYKDGQLIDPLLLYPPSVIPTGKAPEPTGSANHDTSIPQNLNDLDKIMGGNVSSYCYETSDNFTADGRPLTASGTKAQEYRTVAASPNLLRSGRVHYGSRIYIPECKDWSNNGVFIVEDTGSNLFDIDIYLESKSDALSWGRRSCTIYILPGEQDLSGFK